MRNAALSKVLLTYRNRMNSSGCSTYSSTTEIASGENRLNFITPRPFAEPYDAPIRKTRLNTILKFIYHRNFSCSYLIDLCGTASF